MMLRVSTRPHQVALVTVRSDSPGVVIPDVPMLLDTGADVSVLPRSHVASLAQTGAEEYELEAFDGTKSTAPAIAAEVQFLNKSFRGQFLLIGRWHGVLGRNILNNLSILFDGPSHQWSERA